MRTAARYALLLTLAGGCGSVPDTTPDPRVDAATPADGATPDSNEEPSDGPPGPKCSHDTVFDTMGPVAGLNTTASEHNAWLSHDELTIIFDRGVSNRRNDLVIATRTSRNAPFVEQRALDELNTVRDEYKASMTDDGLTIYYDTQQADGSGYAIYKATRPRLDAEFSNAAPVAVVNSAAQEFEPFLTPDGLYFATTRNSDSGSQTDLYFAPTAGVGFGTPVLLEEPSSDLSEEVQTPSADGLALYFTRYNAPQQGHDLDVWVATRASTSEPFTSSHPVASVNTTSYDYPGWLSDDNCRLYFSTKQTPGKNEIWMASRRPL